MRSWLLQVSQTGRPPWWAHLPPRDADPFCALFVLLSVALCAALVLGRRR